MIDKTIHTREWTYEEMLKHLPSESRFELRNNELIEMPSPTILHQQLLKIVFKILERYISSQQKGSLFFAPLDVVFNKNHVVQPDLIFIANNNLSILGEKNIQGAPDLLIEIVSKSSTVRDYVEKKADYEKFGVKEYWIVDPMYQNITVYHLKDEKYINVCTIDGEETLELKSELFPDLNLMWNEVFAATISV